MDHTRLTMMMFGLENEATFLRKNVVEFCEFLENGSVARLRAAGNLNNLRYYMWKQFSL